MKTNTDHIIAGPVHPGDWDSQHQKIRKEVEGKYLEALRTAGFFKRLYLRHKIRQEICHREAGLLRIQATSEKNTM